MAVRSFRTQVSTSFGGCHVILGGRALENDAADQRITEKPQNGLHAEVPTLVSELSSHYA